MQQTCHSADAQPGLLSGGQWQYSKHCIMWPAAVSLQAVLFIDHHAAKHTADRNLCKRDHILNLHL